jgi:hypothetical protein
MTTGPQDELAPAGRGRLRASHADREQAIELLKAAFVQDRLDKDEFDARVGQAFVSRTYAELAAVTADIPAEPDPAEPAAAESAASGPVVAGPVPASTPARTLARGVRRSAICMLVAFALVGLVAMSHSEWFAAMAFFPWVAAIIAASGFLGYGVVDAWNERRSGGQLPPRPGRDGGGPEGGRLGRSGRDPALPRARHDHNRTDMRAPSSWPGRPRRFRRDAPVPRRTWPVPGTV